jgi:hypothetical protein
MFHFILLIFIISSSFYFSQNDTDEPIRSTVNLIVVYSYAVIVETAVAISKHESWLTTEIIQALKFPHIG